MLQHPNIEFVPWDSDVFGIPCYELTSLDDEVLEIVGKHPGHYTFRANPTSSKKALLERSFYYCDTLMDPFCTKSMLIKPPRRVDLSVTKDVCKEDLLKISSGVFSHDRFHRDSNIPRELADKRFDNWLRNLCEAGHDARQVYGIVCSGKVAGFIAGDKNRLLLAAIAEEFRGKGIAKHLWFLVCKNLFEEGYDEISTSVSACNSAIVNLYVSLGFRFRNPVDIYHKLVK